MKDHERRELVNALCAAVMGFHSSQQLRERLSRCLEPVDKLREQLATEVFNVVAWKQRAEAAEAKLKAASEQKPVAWFWETAQEFRTAAYKNSARPEYVSNYSTPLYAAPIPPADVQWYKDLLARSEEKSAQQYAEYQIQQKRIAELERKLAEYRNSENAMKEPTCNPHPDAPHGFCRNASHSEGRYVCECEGWKPEMKEC